MFNWCTNADWLLIVLMLQVLNSAALKAKSKHPAACKTESLEKKPNGSQSAKPNGLCGGDSDGASEGKHTPTESQSPLHFLADLAEQKSREEKKGGERVCYRGDTHYRLYLQTYGL